MIEPVLTEISQSVLAKRYLIRNAQQEIIETPQALFQRVAKFIASAETSTQDREKWEAIFYRLMASCEFEPNTPCLVNAGRPDGTGQLSACFVLPVEDSMDGIFTAMRHMALVQKTGGGTGFGFSRLRPEGDFVASTSGIASGPCSFMEVFDFATERIKQGGVRRGANMGILRVDHPDILKFIQLKQDPAKMQNFNVSVAVTDAFMFALEADQDYDLIHPVTGHVVGQLNARQVWNAIVHCAHRIGDPGLWFIDRTNALDPLSEALGPIESTNPCGEVPLRPFDACCLGSINLAKFYVEKTASHTQRLGNVTLRHGTLDFERLQRTVHQGVRFLDNMLTVNRYPIPEIADVTSKCRKIGLGVMGWADLLIQLGLSYDSHEARELGGHVMACVDRWSVEASEALAEERGAFHHWPVSKWAKRGDKPRRHATTTVIAPTGSISMIAGCSSGIEPPFALSITREQAGLTMQEVNPLVEKIAKREGFWSDALAACVRQTGSLKDAPGVPDHWRAVFAIANELDTEAHIGMQAAFQAQTQDAVSKTINLHRDATEADVERAYQLAWQQGCKGITVYRDGCREGQVLTAGVVKTATTVPEAGPVKAPASSTVKRRVPRSGVRIGVTLSKSTPYGTVHMTLNNHPDDNDPFELFVRVGKSGSEVMAWAEAFGRVVSYTLSIPSSFTPRARLEEVARQLSNIGGGDVWAVGQERVVSAPDAIAKMLLKHLGRDDDAAVDVDAETSEEPNVTVKRNATATYGDLCPACGKATFIYQQRCGLCTFCGHSKC